MKPPEELNIADMISINGAGFFKIQQIIPFRKKVIVSGLTLSNGTTPIKGHDLDGLKSPQRETYFLSGIECLRDIELQSFKINSIDLLGPKGNDKITGDEFPEGIPYPLLQWAYNISPVIDIKNVLGINLSSTNVLAFTGFRFKLIKVRDNEAKAFLEDKGLNGLPTL